MTALGLAVAIPAVLAYNALRARQPPGAGAARCLRARPVRGAHHRLARRRSRAPWCRSSRAAAREGSLRWPSAASTAAAQRAPMAEINMIPLIDVMLVLLVIFIITAPLLTHAVKVDLPKASSQPNLTKPDNMQLGDRRRRRASTGTASAWIARRWRARMAAPRRSSSPQPEVHIRADSDGRLRQGRRGHGRRRQGGPDAHRLRQRPARVGLAPHGGHAGHHAARGHREPS